jgi:PTS system galactitol-specific IIC component
LSINTIIDPIVSFLNYFTNLGNVLMMPLVLTLLSIILGMNVIDAVRNSVKVGLGFMGFTLINNIVIGIVGPAISLMIEHNNMSMNVLDLGWPAVSTIAYATMHGATILIVGLIFNIILVLLKLVRTLNVDLWNYWQWALTGSFVTLLTGSFWWGLAAALIQEIITLLMADASAKMVQEHLKDMPGVSISHSFALIVWFLAIPFTKLWDLLGWKSGDNKGESPTVGKKMGFLLDPVLLGLVIGIGIGILGYSGADLSFGEKFQNTLMVGMASAALMVLLPRMVTVLIEGIKPISEQARTALQSKLSSEGHEIYIGMDSAIMVNDETILAASILLVPVLLLLSPILPGNRIIPFAGITGVVYNICMISPLVKGNLPKLVVTSTIVMAIILILGSNWAPEVTRLVAENGLALPDGAANVSFFANPVTWSLVAMTRVF